MGCMYKKLGSGAVNAQCKMHSSCIHKPMLVLKLLNVKKQTKNKITVDLNQNMSSLVMTF